MNAWRPIETAPKDGTHDILLGCRERVGSGHYWISANGKRRRWVWEGWPRLEPTHWMPLPKAPT